MVDKGGEYALEGCYGFATGSGCKQNKPHPEFETCGAEFKNCTPCPRDAEKTSQCAD